MPIVFGRQTGPRYFPELGPEESPEEEAGASGGTGQDFGSIPILSGLLENIFSGGLVGGGGQEPNAPTPQLKGIEATAEGTYVVTYRGYPAYETDDLDEAQQVYNSLGPGPAPGTFQIVEPSTGKGYVIGFDDEGAPRIIDEIAPSQAGGGAMTPTQRDLDALLASGVISQQEYNEAQRKRFLGTSGTAGFASSGLRDAQYALSQGLITPEQYNQILQSEFFGGGTGGITAYQQAQLDLDRERLGLQRDQFGLQKQQAAIGASRAGNPLAYFGLTTGATPQEALNAVPLAPFQSQLRMGGPIGRPFISGPGNETAPEGYRVPGVQAQARMTPLQTAMNQERNAVEFGVPDIEQQAMEDRVRKGFFGSGGLSSLRFGGTAR